jgi:uncharacterized SAM-binding protein YcdF (DUF218 family)
VARGRSLRFLLALVLCLGVLFLARGLWLPCFGTILVHDDGPAKADIAIVLGGDYYGHRLEKAASLVRDGYVPHVLVSGPPGFFGRHESDLAIEYGVSKGYPRDWFESIPHSAMNTRDESKVLLDELRRRGVQKALIVTSDFHTARARRTFLATEKSMGGGPELRMVATTDEFFRPKTWWISRESQKVVFFEWCKTIATAVGY